MRQLLGVRLKNCRNVIDSCGVCPLAKHTRLPFPLSTTKTTTTFHLLHLDIWGPYHTPTFDGNKFFLTVVDDYSRVTWICLLKFKSDMVNVLRNFLKMIKTQFQAVVQVVMTDNGSEFVNTAFVELLSAMGILHQRSCVYTPQQNGVAERKHRHILEVARAVKFQGHIPLKFWGHCILAAIYIINRLPSMMLNRKSPYVLFYG